MVDFQVFLESQPWVLYSEFSPIDPPPRPSVSSIANPPRTPAAASSSSSKAAPVAAVASGRADDGDEQDDGDDLRSRLIHHPPGLFSPYSPFDYKRVLKETLKLGAKRQRRHTIFEGKSCFLVDNAICAIDFSSPSFPNAPLLAPSSSSDLFAFQTEVIVDDGALIFEWTNDQNTARCTSCVNHHAVAFMRRSRARFRSPQPSWVSFDFGRVQIRLWRPEAATTTMQQQHQDFSLELFQSLHESLSPASPSNHDSDATKISTPAFACDLSDRAFLDSITEAVDQAERAERGEDQKGLFEALTDIVRLVAVKRNNM